MRPDGRERVWGARDLQTERNSSATNATNEPESQWAARFVQSIVLCVLVAAPWAFGSVEPWARFMLFVAIAVALVVSLVQLARQPRESLAIPLAALPLVLGLLLGVGQTVALPRDVLSVLSPGASRLRDQVLPASPETLDGTGQFSAELPEPTVSLYPSATSSRILELSLYLAAFLLGFQYFRRRRAQVWLCGVATAVGGVIALFGIIQWISGTHRIYWIVELSQGGVPFGPFVNRNNAGGFLNLCLAAALGLLFGIAQPRRRRGAHRHLDMPPWVGDGLIRRWLGPLADLSAVRLGLFATTGLMVASVLCTLSRGAFLAMVGGAAAVLVASFAMKRSRGAAVLAALGVSAVLLIAWAGTSDAVQRRLATLFPDSETKTHPLFPHWQDSLAAVPDFWPLGSGMGTYRFVYRVYERDQQSGNLVFYHAENLYLETLLEMGIVGLGLVLAALATTSVAAWKVARTAGGEYASPLAFGGVFLVASQAIHSAADFGLYVPANALWFAVLCGSLVGRAMLVRRLRAAETHETSRPRFAAVLLPTGAAGLLLLNVLGALDVAGAIGPTNALRDWRLAPKETVETTAQQVESTIAAIHKGLPGVWTDAEMHQALAEMYLLRYRIEAEAALRSLDDAEPTDLPAPESTADPLLLSAKLHGLPDSEREEARRTLDADLTVQRNLLPAARHSLLARQFCPLLPRIEIHLAELCFLMRSGDSDAVYLDRARLLAPSDAAIWFGAGLLDWHARRPEAACRSWRHSLELSDSYLVPILDLCGTNLSSARISAELLPDRPAILLAAAKHLYPGDDAVAERRPFLEKASGLLASESAPLSGEELWVKASLSRQLGDREAALDAYRAALAHQPRQVEWRYEYAACLFDQEQLQQALSQVEIVLDLSPGHAKARQLSKLVRRAIAEGASRRDHRKVDQPSNRSSR